MFDISQDQGRSGVGKSIRSCILNRVMNSGSFTVAEIAGDSGFSSTTVSKYISTLLDNGKLRETGKVSLHTKGRKTVRYGIPSDSFYFLGVDMRTFELSIGLIDFIGQKVAVEHFDDFRLDNTHDVLDLVCKRILDFIDGLDGLSREKISAVNINIPGRVNSRTGTSATTFNFEDTAGVPLTEYIGDKIGMKVYIENDTKAMAYGEYMSWAAGKYSNILYINIGWGFGLGIIIDGKLYYGKDGYSGEIGHVHLYENNVLCHCGKKGCLETEVSMRAIRRKLTERISKGETSLLSPKVQNGGTITVMDILDAVEKEDALCIEIVSQTGTRLGHILAGLINIFNPEAIIIGGNLSKVEPCYFLQPVETEIRKYALRLMCRDVPVTTSRLGDDTAVIGACLIARSKMLDGQ